MPVCGCTTPCNCYIDEDGYRAERPEDGRHNVMVSGNSTIEDPLTISFMQSEFFRPPAAELRKTTIQVVPNNDPEIVQGNTYDVTVYQSPSQILVVAPAPSAVSVALAFSNFFIAGASATFAAHATGDRILSLYTADPFTDISAVVAGASQNGLASRSSILTCSGFVQGYLDNTGFVNSGFIDPRSTPFVVALYQTSGVPMNVTNIKLWVGKI